MNRPPGPSVRHSVSPSLSLLVVIVLLVGFKNAITDALWDSSERLSVHPIVEDTESLPDHVWQNRAVAYRPMSEAAHSTHGCERHRSVMLLSDNSNSSVHQAADAALQLQPFQPSFPSARSAGFQDLDGFVPCDSTQDDAVEFTQSIERFQANKLGTA